MQKCTTTTPPLFVETSSAYLTKFAVPLSKTVVFALFRDQTSSTQKQKMANELLKYGTSVMKNFHQTPESSKCQFFNNKLNFIILLEKTLELCLNCSNLIMVGLQVF